jgi:uncharacterized membrane protein
MKITVVFPLVPRLGPAFDQLVPTAVSAVLAIVAVPWLLRTFRATASSNRNSPGVSSAEEIRRERYARGDLDRTQFFLMLDDLKAESPRKA